MLTNPHITLWYLCHRDTAVVHEDTVPSALPNALRSVIYVGGAYKKKYLVKFGVCFSVRLLQSVLSEPVVAA